MKDSSTNSQSNIEPSNPRHNSFSTWAVVGVLSALLVAAGVIGYLGWTSTDASVPASGYVAMALGVVFSLAVGAGLMALIFYSSRKGTTNRRCSYKNQALIGMRFKGPHNRTAHDPAALRQPRSAHALAAAISSPSA